MLNELLTQNMTINIIWFHFPNIDQNTLVCINKVVYNVCDLIHVFVVQEVNNFSKAFCQTHRYKKRNIAPSHTDAINHICLP